MNEQELIERIKRLDEPYLKAEFVLELVKQLDEPKPVQVPQFVADFIAEQKKLGYTLSYSIDASMSDRVAEWYWDNSEVFALAWILGYELEKEKRHLVKVKGICGNHETLNCEKHSKKWLFSDREDNSLYKTKHTRKELEDAGFSEVFNSPLFEVEEVEG
jgi:hypothetical protein